MIKASVRMWSDVISFKKTDHQLIGKLNVIYDAGDNIVKMNGETSNSLAKQNYISTIDDDIVDDRMACLWIKTKLHALNESLFRELIVSGAVQATLWLAIFEPSKLLHDNRLATLSQTAQAANVEIFLEDYTDLSVGGNPRKYHMGAGRT